MRSLRKAAFLLLLVYFGLVAGANYHTHAQDPQVTLHCKICDFSQTFGSQPAHFSLTNQISVLGIVPAVLLASHSLEPQNVMPGRSPPLS